MQFSRHINITGGALRQWFVAQCYDSAAVGGCGGWAWYLQVPWAPFWAIWPRAAIHSAFRAGNGSHRTCHGRLASGFEQFVYVIILYGGIVVVDGLRLQPVIMRRTARVPIWASLIVPICSSLVFGFWGLRLAAPAVGDLRVSSTRETKVELSATPRQTPPGQVITGGQLISPGTPSGQLPPQD